MTDAEIKDALDYIDQFQRQFKSNIPGWHMNMEIWRTWPERWKVALLALEDARAEVARLESENERLRMLVGEEHAHVV